MSVVNVTSQLEEHAFFENSHIKITSAVIEYNNTIISTKAISSVIIDKEEVDPPNGLLGGGILFYLFGQYSDNETLAIIGTLSFLSGLFYMGTKKFSSIKSLIITMDSGEKFILDEEHIEDTDLQVVLKCIRDAIIFRG
ncbi:hypothetical protein [Thalassobacillus cyri]|uniref:hypothetical protein n=1 Tax=Thalassobacillus cyri TaxID=571932 RepID=UPI00115F8F8A|nr:hypothetical protein [Thalassobacillus cyri]